VLRARRIETSRQQIDSPGKSAGYRGWRDCEPSQASFHATLLATKTAAKEDIMDTIRFSTVATHLADVLARAGLHNDLGRIIGRARALVRWQVRVIERRRRIVATRAALEALDDRTLKDIGLHRAELRAVAAGVYGGERVRRDAQAQLRQAA